MENMVRATLISNAGLLLEYRGVKLLVDAIYHTTDPFSTSPPAVWSAMLAGEPPFDGVDTLLFTHDHPDHFSPERLMQYLRYRTVIDRSFIFLQKYDKILRIQNKKKEKM